MRRIDLKMNEQYKYEIVKKLVDTDGNKLAAERKLNVSRRLLNRYIAESFGTGNIDFKTPLNLYHNFLTNMAFLYENSKLYLLFFNLTPYTIIVIKKPFYSTVKLKKELQFL